MKDRLSTCDKLKSLGKLVALVIRTDNHLHERRKNKGIVSLDPLLDVVLFCLLPFSSPCIPPPVPGLRMQFNNTHEWQQRFAVKFCVYFDQPGHFIATYPVWPKTSTRQYWGYTGGQCTSWKKTPATPRQLPQPLQTLLDYRAEQNLVDKQVVHQLGIAQVH